MTPDLIIGGIVFLALLGVAFWMQIHSKPKRWSDPDVYRNVVKTEPEIPARVLATMDCGHQVEWSMSRMTTCKCDICTQLAKERGEK